MLGDHHLRGGTLRIEEKTRLSIYFYVVYYVFFFVWNYLRSIMVYYNHFYVNFTYFM